MKQDTFEIEAASLDETRSRVNAKMPPGFFLLSETIVWDGRPITIREWADTTDAALTAARGRVPPGARIEYEKEIAKPEARTLRVSADAEGAARSQTQLQIDENSTITKITLAIPGRKGFLGIGKTQNRYDVEILRYAEVEIKCKADAKIVVTIGDEIRDGCYVICGACRRQAKVRMFDRGKIALVGPNEMRAMQRDNVALKCQDCGYIICFSCASSQTGSVGIPTCPSCTKEGGPYFFTT